MRQRDNARISVERIIRIRGLVPVHVEADATELALGECCNECVAIDDTAARDVDYERAGPQRSERCSANEPARRIIEWTVDADRVACAEEFVALILAFAALFHVGLLILEHVFTPSPTLGHELAARAIRRGAYSRLFWFGAIGLGGVAPLALVWIASTAAFSVPVLALAAVVALAGGFAWEYIWVEAGQSVPNS